MTEPLDTEQQMSRTEEFVRFKMRTEGRRQYQVIALRILCEQQGNASIRQIRNAIKARHPDNRWDRRFPLQVLADHGLIEINHDMVSLSEHLGVHEIASVLAALEERSVRTQGLRVEDSSWRPDAKEWVALRNLVIKRDGEVCSVAGCQEIDELELDHRWRGSLLAADGWPPAAINNPINLQLLCQTHHGSKTRDETRLLHLRKGVTSGDVGLPN